MALLIRTRGLGIGWSMIVVIYFVFSVVGMRLRLLRALFIIVTNRVFGLVLCELAMIALRMTLLAVLCKLLDTVAVVRVSATVTTARVLMFCE